jgi:hypothetical protein
MYPVFKTILLNPIIIFSRMFYTLYIPLVSLFGLSLTDHNTKGHSHVLSLVYATIGTMLSPISVYMALYDYFPQTFFIVNLSKFVYYISLSYFSVDLVLGIQYYPKILKKDIVTFGVHHCAYICILVYGNMNNLLPLYVTALPLEIPTLVMSLGYINNKYQNPKLFGVLFFTFRILYTGLLVYKSYSIHYGIHLFSVLILCLHTYWFRSYLRKYLV